MYPHPIAEFTNPVERDLYLKFEKDLDQSYTVFYGRSWSQTRADKNPYPEIDFLICQEGAGMLLLEVKGGRWERKNGSWWANNHQVSHSDDPEKQLLGNKSALIAFLRSTPNWQNTFFPIDIILALPQTMLPEEGKIPGLLPIMDSRYLPYIPEWIKAAMFNCTAHYPYSHVTNEMLNHTKNMLMKDYMMNLKDILEINEQQLVILTDQQLQMDRNLEKKKQITIQGCAGSGKTLFAIKQAKRLATTPNINRILLTCFNWELGEWLKEQTKGIQQRCITMPFRAFCEDQLIKHHKIGGTETKTKEYLESLPYKLFEIIDEDFEKFDAIIVDEGQSFEDDWWVVLKSMLKDEKSSRFYIFFDDLQRIYNETKNHVPGEDEAFELTVNIRNTAKIHNQAVKFLPKEKLPDSNNVAGEDVGFMMYHTEKDMKDGMRKTLDTLIRDGRISSKDIIILSAKSMNSCLRDVRAK